MKHLALILLIPITWLLTSCDPVVSYHHIVKNYSSNELVILQYINAQIDTTILPPQGAVIIASDSQIGTISSLEDCNSFYLLSDSLKVNTNNGLVLTKDINNISEWLFVVFYEGSFDSGECGCVFKIYDTDFQ